MKKEPTKTLSPYEQQLILAHIVKKSREYVLAHPELRLSGPQEKKYKNFLKRRQNREPLAYILGHREFFGLDFKVTKDTLIPRPETEHLVEAVIGNLRLKDKKKKILIVDVGTGSGNIIVSIANELKKSQLQFSDCELLGTDISKKALLVARLNARKNKVGNPPAGGIKFIQSDLLGCFLENQKTKIQDQEIIIAANLPYLSRKIYSSAIPDVKNFEPESALLSGADGLDHYEKLLKQIKILENNSSVSSVLCFMEISPEQKTKLGKIIKLYLPESKINFQKDLAGKWRLAGLKIQK